MAILCCLAVWEDAESFSDSLQIYNKYNFANGEKGWKNADRKHRTLHSEAKGLKIPNWNGLRCSVISLLHFEDIFHSQVALQLNELYYYKDMSWMMEKKSHIL